MKANPSRYVLAAEILAIILFHVVKFKKNEKESADMVFSPVNKTAPFHKPAIVNKSGIEYMLVNLMK
jgi:hypothetical protein